MEHDQELDQSLRDLNESIVWNTDRQKHVRHKLINEINPGKPKRLAKFRSKLLPALSLVFVITIITIMALSEFGTTDMATPDNVNYRTSGEKGDGQTQLSANDDEQGNNVSDKKDTAGNEQQIQLLTQTEIMTAIKGQMTSELPLKLPREINLPEGQRLTAVTSSDTNSYEVIFYQHDEPIPINNKLLFSNDNPAEVVARVHAERYATTDQADDIISHETFDESMGQPVRLSAGLTGYQDAGAGSVWTSWNIGRWALTTHASSNDRASGVALAKKVIAYLDKYYLPAPQPNGYIHLNVDHAENLIVWENGTTVYTVDQVNDPLLALEIVVNFE